LKPVDSAPLIGHRSMTPLWVIALFLSLTETVVGVGVIQTRGNIQLILTIFVVAFPALVALVFFAIIWRKPYHLYAPTDFGSMDFAAYIEAMRGSHLGRDTLFQEISNAVAASLRSDQTVTEVMASLGKEARPEVKIGLEAALGRTANRTVERVRSVGFLAIDTRPLLGVAGNVRYFPYSAEEEVSSLLDAIWLGLGEKADVPAFSYGSEWILRDSVSGRRFQDIGRRWARRTRGEAYDKRPLREVGIEPGMTLEAVPAVHGSRGSGAA
jgi:hypothetical protein